MNIEAIAHFRSPFGSKFGIPRQSGVVKNIRGSIILTPQWRKAEALEGITDFDYLWLIWGFSENVSAPKHATVRPPRLGGNVRKGVFATRSSFRPNNLALSSVRIEAVEWKGPEAPIIHVSGADLMDGTPIYDIKPYITFTDSHADAKSGFADTVAWQQLEVSIPQEYGSLMSQDDLQTLHDILAQDPRPSYQSDAERIYGMEYAGRNVQFRVKGHLLEVLPPSDMFKK